MASQRDVYHYGATPLLLTTNVFVNIRNVQRPAAVILFHSCLNYLFVLTGVVTVCKNVT